MTTSSSSPHADNAPPPEGDLHSFFSILGSLWIGAVLLMLLLVAMACATVFESRYSLPFAKEVFYHSWWFLSLLGLFAVNVFCAILVRFPITRKRTGFLLTHFGLLIIVAGALLTGELGIDGVLPITEGDTSSQYRLRQDALTLIDRLEPAPTVVELTAGGIGGFTAIDNPGVPVLVRDNVRIEVEKYLPDSESVEHVVDDNPRVSPAIALVWDSHGTVIHEWLFAGRLTDLGPRKAIYRYFPDATKLSQALAENVSSEPTSLGSIRIEINDKAHEIAIETCAESAVPVGDTEYSVRLIRYLPHATVGADKKLTNASPRPENPAIELELTGPEGVQKRTCFAKFPDFQTIHGAKVNDDLKVTFISTPSAMPSAPLEFLGGPDGVIYVRFSGPKVDGAPQKVTLGNAFELPWHHEMLTVTNRFQNARMDHSLEAVEPVRKERVAAIQVKIDSGKDTSTMWLQRGYVRSLTIDGKPYQLQYGDRTQPLGFNVKLNNFKVVNYPGGGQPRAFVSNITITDPATGNSRTQTVSMNHPAKYGGFTLFQSSYQMGRGKTMSILSVSRDPGLPVVFAGYIVCFIGMVWVLVDRVQERKRIARLLASQESV